MQLAWNLRPFVGAKNLPFEVFREKEGNFYLAITQSVTNFVIPDGAKKNDSPVKNNNNEIDVSTLEKNKGTTEELDNNDK